MQKTLTMRKNNLVTLAECSDDDLYEELEHRRQEKLQREFYASRKRQEERNAFYEEWEKGLQEGIR